MPPEQAGSNSALTETATKAIDAAREELFGIALDIHAHPELNYQEFHAAKLLSDTLEAHDFAVERGIGGVETAFRATLEGGAGDGPTVAVLAEYDALPEIGLGCGHNLIAMAGLGAGLGVQANIKNLPGRLVVIGTPAEEGGGGKIKLLDAGVFDGVDICLSSHPSSNRTVIPQDIPLDESWSLAAECSIPVLRSDLSTKDFYRHIKPYLDAVFAPQTNVHGSLADVYGVGLLFVGDSGVGKSECVLDLVERGHRLVADDHIIASRRGPDILLGQGHQHPAHHMEIRGLGIIDIRALFGIHATRQQKRIEEMVRLQRWDEDTAYTRTGLDTTEVDLLGIKIPEVTIPLNAGKNITVISEVVAMNHLLKYAGIDSAAAFNQKLQDAMRPVHEYFEQDYE